MSSRGGAARSAAYEPGQWGRVDPCFAPGTPVHTPTGLRGIEELEVGDLVLAWDPGANQLTPRPVLAVLHGVTDVLVELVVDSEEIRATRNHPVWVPSAGRYLPAGTFSKQTEVQCVDGTKNIEAVRHIAAPSPTLNLEVGELHNYHVGTAGVRVHNGNGDSPSLRSYRNPARRRTWIYAVEERVGPGQYRTIYVGKTYNDVQGRFVSGHLAELDDARKARWLALRDADATSPLSEPRIRSRAIASGEWNNAETAVWERHMIDRHGGLDALENRGNPMTRETFDRLRREGLLTRVCP